MKRIMAFVLVLAMLFCDVPASALYREAEPPETVASVTSEAAEIYGSESSPSPENAPEKEEPPEETPVPEEKPEEENQEETPVPEEKPEEENQEESPLVLSITRNLKTAPLSSSGVARFTVSASLTGENAASYSLTYSWQYCSTSDSASAVAGNPSKYEWKDVSKLSGIQASANNGTLKLTGTADAFKNLYFRCIISAADLTQVSAIAAVDPDAAPLLGTSAAPNCEHNWVPSQWHDPTCAEGGYNATTCDICGAVQENTKVYNPDTPRHLSGLDWLNPMPCCTDGYAIYRCTVCGGYGYYRRYGAIGDGTSHIFEGGKCIVPGCEAQQPHEHSWDSGTVITPASCNTPGEKLYHCTFSGCGESKTETIPPLGNHTWNEGETVEATCTEEGCLKYTCTTCGLTKKENVVSPLGHTPGSWVIDAEATCTEAGAEHRECSVCHSEESLETRTVPALGHDWDEGEITKPATCQQEGVLTFTCKRCSATKMEPIAKLEHTKGALIETILPTCQLDGKEIYECTKCSDHVEVVLPKDANAHAWSDWAVVTPATCQSEGESERHCENSGCTEAETKFLPIDPDAHTWGEWKIIVPATCQSAGLEKHTCQNEGCNAEETREIPMADHNFVNHVCTVCGLSYPKTEEVRNRVDALPDPAEITIQNVDSVYKEILAIEELINNLTEDENYALNNLYPDRLTKLADLLDICETLLSVTKYEPHQGHSVFTVSWNDNTTSDMSLRTPVDSFLSSANAKLSYTITSKDGSVTVSSGTLPLTNAADALKNAFGFLYDDSYVFPSEPLMCSRYGDTAYQIITHENLPVSYKVITTDFATMEEKTEDFVIHYQLQLDNPASSNYVYTLPEPISGGITLNAGDTGILTKLIDWKAYVDWRDDNNRSASSGETFASDSPRVSTDAFRNNTEVYVYPSGSNPSSADVVTSDYGYSVSGSDSGNTWEVSLTRLPAYDNSGSVLNYFIKNKTDRIDAANGNGNYYRPDYWNRGNYASFMDGLYNGGTVKEYLSNTVPFTVNKVWDDTDSSGRPDTKLYVWRTIEKYDASGNLTLDTTASYAIPGTTDFTEVPTDVPSGELVEVSIGGTGWNFDMYDSDGHRYVYYGVEKGLTGSYQLSINNRTADAQRRNLGSVISKFNASRYFVNGATLYNASALNATPSLRKTFVGSSLQGLPGLQTTFLLQKKTAEGTWVNATEDDIVDASPDAVVTKESVTVTLSNFNTENMTNGIASADSSPVSVNYYDADFNLVEYRWIEVSVSVNGGTATLSASNWSNGKYNGEIALTEGNAQSGPEGTTIIFNATEKDGTTTNTLSGEHPVQIKKYWYDMYGNSIADPSKVTDPELDISNAKARFRIVRDDGATTEDGSLTDIHGNPIEDIFLTVEDLTTVEGGTDYWTRVLDLPRYDGNGTEYYYTVQELSVDGLTEIGWLKDQRYETEYYEENGIWKKRTVSIHINTMGDSTVLVFDVEKLWQDESDLKSRNPVNVRIYRFRDALGNLLDTPVAVTGTLTLSTENNWYQLKKINGLNMVDPETGETVYDTVANYLVLEDGISVDGTTIPTHTSKSMQAIFEELSANLNKDCYVGTVGSNDAVGSNWDGLNYLYRVTESITNLKKQFTDNCASYSITNTRAGLQNYELTKTWNSGSVVKGAEFGLYSGDELIAQFTVRKVVDSSGSVTLAFDPSTDFIPHFDADPSSDYSSVQTPVFSYTTDAKSGNFVAYFNIDGLPKFNKSGKQNDISLREINMIDDEGNRISVASGTAVIDGVNYSVSLSSDVTYADKTYHHSGDIYAVSIENSCSGSYHLTSNKVWRDDHTYVRPDVRFSIQRIPAKGELLEHVKAKDTDAILSYIKRNQSSAEKVMQDCYWNTVVNDFWWTCETDAVAQYDSEGYPYVYFAVEKTNGDSNIYEGYYCNRTAGEGYRPINAAKPTEEEKEAGITWTQKVFSAQDLPSASGNYFLLADGVNTSGGKYQDYYSATVVNRPEMDRTVNGTKIWKLPLGWTIPEEEFPEVTVSLYRSTKEINSSDYENADDYVRAVIDAAELVDVVTSPTSSEKIIDQETVNYTTHYNYEFPVPEKGYTLDWFNKWGTVYHYYTIEEITSKIPNFPSSIIVYESNNFNITNVFSPDAPYAEVTVKKTWDISKDERYAGKIQTLEDLEASDLSDAEITLYGSATSGEGKIGTDNEFGKVILSPTADGNVITRNPDGSIATITATYTFTSYTADDGTTQKLPYYWITDKPMWYSLTENKINGYDQNGSTSSEKIVINDHVTFGSTKEDESGTLVYYNSETDGTISSITNTYIGELKDASFMKKWSDGYVDNDEYRPGSIALLIHRTSDSGEISGVVDTYNAGTYSRELNNFVVLDKLENSARSVWAVGGKLENLLKYDPKGNEYTYYVYGEVFDPVITDGVLDLSSSKVVSIDSEDRKISEYYEMTDYTGTSVTNTFFEDARVTVTADKNWKLNYNKEDDRSLSAISYEQFNSLRAMGLIPNSVQYIVLRRPVVDGVETPTWETVPATATTDPGHITEYSGRQVLGRLVDLASATKASYSGLLNPNMKWTNLPKYAALNSEYEYAVGEIVTWKDGSSSGLIIDSAVSEKMTSSISTVKEEGTVVNFASTLTNSLKATRLRLAKQWVDNKGKDNTRPDYINLTIRPVNGNVALQVSLYASEDKATSGSGTEYNKEKDIYYSTTWIDVPYVSSIDEIKFGLDSGNTYVITETLVYNERSQYRTEYTQIINSSDPGAVTDNGDNTFVLRVKNTLDDQKKSCDLNASKTWSGDKTSYANWIDLTRPIIRYQLQYLEQGSTGKWIDFTDETIKGFITDESAMNQTAIQDVPYEDATGSRYGTKYSVSWTKMQKYWSDPSADGVAELIQYRIVELPLETDTDVFSLAAYTPNPSTGAQSFNVTADESTVPATANITNTLKTNTIKIKKTWVPVDASGTPITSALSKAYVQCCLNMDSLPYRLNFQLEYQENGSTEWKNVPYTKSSVTNTVSGIKNGAFTMNTIDIASASSGLALTGVNLPKLDKNGKEILYRVREVSVTYKTGTVPVENGKAGDITVTDSDGASINVSGAKVFSLTNSYHAGKVTVEKLWNDSNNRDAVRDATITTKMYRDGVTASDFNSTLTGTGAADNMDSHTFQYLPVYKNGSATEKSAYTFYEVPTENLNTYYTTTYAANGEEKASYQEAVIAADQTNPGKVTITNTHRSLMSVDASKEWNDYENRYGQRPESVDLTLQYSTDGTNWTDVANISAIPSEVYRNASTTPDADNGSTVFTTSAVTQTVNKDGKWTGAHWDNLPTYALVNGVSKQIQYRAFDNVSGYGYTFTKATGTKASKASDASASIKATNSASAAVNVTKTWTEADYSWLTRPDSIQVCLVSRPKGTTGDFTIVAGSNKDLTSANSWKASWSKLSNANEYKVKEVSVTYGTTVINTSGSEDSGSAGAYTYTLTVSSSTKSGVTTTTGSLKNSLENGSLKVDKSWLAEDNRDGMTSVVIKVKRDGEILKDKAGKELTWTISKSNNWTVTIPKLPMYKNSAAAHTEENKSIYEVIELDIDGVTRKISDPVTLLPTGTEIPSTVTIENNYTPVRTDLSVAKVWSDADDAYGSRSENLYFKLQYQLNGAWTDVPYGTIGEDGLYTVSGAKLPGTEAATTSAPNVAGTNWHEVKKNTAGEWAYTWKDLPVNILDAAGNTVKATYRVLEGTKSDSGSITEIDNLGYNNGYMVRYNDSTIQLEKGITASTKVTNTLRKQPLTVSKTWIEPEGMETLVRPASVKFIVEYRLGNGEWKLLPSTVSVTGINSADSSITLTGNTWALTTGGLPIMASDGTAFEYRIKEASISYADGTATASGSYTDDGWKGSVGAYSVSVTPVVSGDKTFTVTASNTLQVASLNLEKIWDDNNNRDGGEKPVELKVYRILSNGTEQLVKTVTLSNANGWKAFVSNLPVYDNYTGAKNVYKIKETGEENGKWLGDNSVQYTVTYSDNITLDTEKTTPETAPKLSVTNQHFIDVFDVKADKHWNDDNNYYGLRSTSVDLQLQYSVDNKASWQNVTVKYPHVPTAPEEDDGKTVFTTSDLVQTLKGSATSATWGPVTWENLPRFVKVNNVTTTVYYRIVETPESIEKSGYTSTPTKAVCYDDAASTGTLTVDCGSVENTLTETLSLDVKKTWDGGGTYSAWPDKVLVTLQVSTDGGNSWANVKNCVDVALTAANGWSYSFENLRKNNGYEYRCIETGIVYLANAAKGTPEETIRTTFTADDKSAGRVGSYNMSTVLTFNKETGAYTVSMKNVYNPTPVRVTIDVLKTVIGDARLTEAAIHRFTFILTGTDGTRRTTSIVDSGSSTFGSFTFNRPGTYRYTVYEINDRTENYTFDTRRHEIVITVTDTHGTLSLSWTGDGVTAQTPAFVNAYKVPDDPPPKFIVIEDPDVPLGWLPFIGKIHLNEGYCFD